MSALGRQGGTYCSSCGGWSATGEWAVGNWGAVICPRCGFRYARTDPPRSYRPEPTVRPRRRALSLGQLAYLLMVVVIWLTIAHVWAWLPALIVLAAGIVAGGELFDRPSKG